MENETSQSGNNRFLTEEEKLDRKYGPGGIVIHLDPDITYRSTPGRTRNRSSRRDLMRLTRLRATLKKRRAAILTAVPLWRSSERDAMRAHVTWHRRHDLHCRLYKAIGTCAEYIRRLKDGKDPDKLLQDETHQWRRLIYPDTEFELYAEQNADRPDKWFLKETHGSAWGDFIELTCKTREEEGKGLLYKVFRPRKYEYEDYHYFTRNM